MVAMSRATSKVTMPRVVVARTHVRRCVMSDQLRPPHSIVKLIPTQSTLEASSISAAEGTMTQKLSRPISMLHVLFSAQPISTWSARCFSLTVRFPKPRCLLQDLVNWTQLAA
jgi:hypothetical protein